MSNGFNDEALFFQDFHDNLHRKNNVEEMASHTNMSKIVDDIYSNKNNIVKKKRLSSGGSSKLLTNRRCKKDRHSTANGSSRGRIMRLSLHVAKEFLGLQDMLGFDEASKTVEWLLMKSQNAIREVSTKRVFGMNHSSPCPSTTKGGTPKAAGAYTRGLREKARARARERTLEKKRLQLVAGFTDYNHLYNCEKSAAAGNKFVNMSTSDPAPVLEVEEYIFNYSKQQLHSFEGSTNTEQLIIDHSLFVTNNGVGNPYTFFNLHHNSGTTS